MGPDAVARDFILFLIGPDAVARDFILFLIGPDAVARDFSVFLIVPDAVARPSLLHISEPTRRYAISSDVLSFKKNIYTSFPYPFSLT